MAFRIRQFFQSHPIARGMAVSSILWPTSNFCQQTLSLGNNREKYDWSEMIRFCAFGSLFGAPSMYNWIKTLNFFFPGNTLKVALSKALVSQFLYTPGYTCIFYLTMNMAEGKNFSNCVEELNQKFMPTFSTGLAVWPAAQTFCYVMIKEKNQVPFLATVGFFWTMYLSYIKHEEVNVKSNPTLIVY